MAGAFLKGVQKFRTNLATFKKKFPMEIARALGIEVNVEAREVKRRTPVDDGTLRGSIHVVGPQFEGSRVSYDGAKIRYLIVAGGPAAPYAVYVHEDPDAFHKVGQWKYLESVIFESRPHMAARVARRIEINRAL